MNDTDIAPERSVESMLQQHRKHKSKGFYRWLWIIAIVVAVIAVGIYLLQKQRSQQQRYLTEAVTRGDLTVTVSATGTLAPLKEVEVGIEVSGTIDSVEVDYNDKVTIGQVMAKLDTTRLEAQAFQSRSALESAQAKVRQAHASVLEAQAQMDRLEHVKQLSAGKVPSQFDLDEATAALARAKADQAAAQAEVRQAQATLEVNLTDIGKAVVRSPINGVVLERSVEPGQTVASQFQAPVLFNLAEDLAQMELQVDVDEADVGRVKPGQRAEFTVDAYPNRKFPAEIIQVRYGSETVDGVVTYKTVLTVDNADLSLRPGMTATAEITVDSKQDVLLVSNKVLRFSPASDAVAPERAKGAIVVSLFPRPPREVKTVQPAATDTPSQQVWTLSDGALKPLTLLKGVSNGVVTEITGGDIEQGTALVYATADSS